jgi:non-ribosomal peptide synthetase-like protein
LVLDNALNVLDSDFFDLGGHSMIAAKLVSSLRSDPMYANVGMTDVYKYRTLKEFSQRLDDISIQATSKNFECDDSQTYVSEKNIEPGKESPTLRAISQVIVKYLCMFISLYCVFWFASLPLLLPSWAYVNIDINSIISKYTGGVSTVKPGMIVLTQSYENIEPISSELTTLTSMLSLLVVMNFTFLLSPLLIILVKWIVIGKLKPGKYPLWGTYYWRWWLVHRLIKLLPLQLFKGWPILVLFYRLLGAKIGKNVHIETPYVSCLDMIHIGNDTSIGIDVYMEGYKVQMDKADENGRRQGWLIIGNTEIGTGCYIGSKSHLSVNTVIPDDTLIGEFSMVPENAKLQHGKSYTASPIYECSREDLGCCFADAAQDPYTRAFSKDVDSRRLPRWLLCILECFAFFSFISVMFVAVIPSIMSFLFVTKRYGSAMFSTSDMDENVSQRVVSIVWIILTPAISGMLYLTTFCLEATAIKWILIGDLKSSSRKVIHIDSWLCVRKRFVDSIMQLSLIIVQSLYATLLLPIW